MSPRAKLSVAIPCSRERADSAPHSMELGCFLHDVACIRSAGTRNGGNGETITVPRQCVSSDQG